MIIALTGENVFALRTELDNLVSEFVKQHGDVALEKLDGEEATTERIQESLRSLPFLTDRKLVVLRTPSVNKQFAELAEKLFCMIPETIDVIIVEPKLDKRSGYYKLLRTKSNFREFRALDEDVLASWLVSMAAERRGSLSLEDARFLVERVGTNQQLLANELEKLLLYSSEVTRITIEALTETLPQSSIFELLEAAFGSNVSRTLAIYEDQRGQRVDPSQIIAMLAWQLHVLALIKTAGIQTLDTVARQAKLNPFVLRKSQRVAQQLSLTELKRFMAGLLTIDARSKRENIDLDETLRLYLLSLASKREGGLLPER